MRKIEEFKNKLVPVFDNDLRTRQWENIVDYSIIALIVISTVEVFLSTFTTIVDKYGHILHFIDILTKIIFTIEIILRIWVASEINPKYKGFKGRIKYCFSFYGLIDIISTFPFYLNFIVPLPYNALKVFRVLRLLRVFRYMKSFRLLSDAIASKKNELLISIQFLAITTVILSFVLFFAEHLAQPDIYDNGLYPMVWAFAQYIGDPGGFAENPPITFVGKIVACIVGVLGIAIFAVPAGLIGSGFMEVIDRYRKEEKDKENVEKLRQSFQFVQCRYTKILRTPQFISISDIQAKQQMNVEDIIDAIHSSDEFRLRNLASARPVEECPEDKLVVEHFFVNRPYGAMIDRKSNVTIVSTSSFSEAAIGHVAYYLAKIGGFNYVSREVANDVSYYNIPHGYSDDNLKLFLEDINKLSSNPNSWIIFLLSSTSHVFPSQFHYIIGGNKGEVNYNDPNLSIKDTVKFDAMYKEFEKVMHEKFGLKSDLQQHYGGTSPKNIARHIGTADAKPNAFTIRIDWSVSCWDNRIINITKEIVDIVNKHFEPEKEKKISSELIDRVVHNDYGYQFYKD